MELKRLHRAYRLFAEAKRATLCYDVSTGIDLLFLVLLHVLYSDDDAAVALSGRLRHLRLHPELHSLFL